MMQLLKARSLLRVKPSVQGLINCSASHFRWIASGAKDSSLQEGPRKEGVEPATEGENGQRGMGFFEAADVLSRPPVKPKRLGFDFHLWMFIVALTPSAIIYLTAQWVRRIVRQQEKELQEKEKAELRAKLEALYSSDDPNQSPGAPNQAPDGPNRPADGSYPVQSRSQRLAADRSERKLGRARAYLDEAQVAALKGLEQPKQAEGEPSSGAGGVKSADGKGENGRNVAEGAKTGQSLGAETAGVARAKGTDVKREEDGRESRGVEKGQGRETKGADGSQVELVWLRAKVAELEQGLKGLEESLRQRESGERGQPALDQPKGPDKSACTSAIATGGPDKAKEATACDRVAGLGRRAKSAGQTETSECTEDAIVAGRKRSLFDYVWPQWLRTSSKSGTKEGRDESEAPLKPERKQTDQAPSRAV